MGGVSPLANPPHDSEQVTLGSPHLIVTVHPARGAEVHHFGPPGGPNLLFWQDWLTPVRASRSTSYGTDERDWLSEWRGGWQELFPNAGATAEMFGIELPFHGEASASRWEVLEVSATALTVRTPSRLPLTLTRHMRLDPDRPVLHLEETVVNESDLEVPFVWGHHPAFDGIPGTQVDAPPGPAVVPDGFDVEFADLAAGEYQWPNARTTAGDEVDLRVLPAGRVERVVYRPDITNGWAALRRPDHLGIGMAWDTTVFRHLWLWTEVGGKEFPWYGRSRVLAVEPVSSWPNDGLAQALRRGRAHLLGPRRTVTSWLTMALFDSTDRPVTAVDREGGIRTDDVG